MIAEKIPQTLIDNLLAHCSMSDLEESFRYFDKDSSGSIDAEELGEVMKSLGMAPTEEELNKMMEEADIDGNGSIDFEEFMGLMAKKLAEEQEEEDSQSSNIYTDYYFSRAFKVIGTDRGHFQVFDKDNEGYITIESLKNVLGSLYEDFTDEDFDEMIRVADTDMDGRISYEVTTTDVRPKSFHQSEIFRVLQSCHADTKLRRGSYATMNMTPGYRYKLSISTTFDKQYFYFYETV